MRTNLTINDIARMANVSKTTVSFVLNNKEGVSEKTRQNVLSIIEKTNYKPELNSKRLYYHKSFTIAVVFDKSAPAFDNMFYFGIMNALLKRCTVYDYALIYSEYNLEGDILQLPENITNKDVDGLIFLKDIPIILISKLHSLGIPFVVADDHSEHSSLHTVKADYRLAAYTAVQYLIQQGHKQIGFIGNRKLPSFYSQVVTGYQEALRESNLSLDLAYFFDSIQERESVESVVSTLRSLPSLPTAIFCMEDILAIELIRYLQAHGLSVPGDVSVISIDDILLSEHIYPSLTTVSINKEEMGYYAIDMLIALIDNKNQKSITISSNNLIVRESVKKLNVD